MNLNSKKIFIILLSSSILTAINSLFWHQIALGVLTSVVYFYFLSFVLGKIFFGEQNKFSRLIFGFLFALGFLSLFSSILIEVGALLKISTLGFLIALSFFALLKNGQNEQKIQIINDDQIINPVFSKLVFVLFLIFSLVLIAVLFMSRTGNYVYRIWNLLPQFYWYIFAADVIFLVCILIGKLEIKTKLLAIIFTSLIIHSTLLVILKYEYGTDNYRHLAKEKILFLEKPIYSIQNFTFENLVNVGAWGLKASLAQITNVPIDIIHKIIPWFFFSTFPIFILFQIGILFFKKRLSALILAASPLFFFEVNVYGMIFNPQTIGFLFLIFSMFLAIRYLLEERKVGLSETIIPIASIFIYPVTGIYSLIFIIMAISFKMKPRWLRSFLIMFESIFAFLIIPVLDFKTGVVLPSINSEFMSLVFMKWLGNIFSSTWQSSFPILLYFLIILGILFLIQDKEKKPILYLIFILFFSLHFSYLWSLILENQFPLFSSRIGLSLYTMTSIILVAGIVSLKNSFDIFSKKMGLVPFLVILPAFIIPAYYLSPSAWSISTREVEAIKFISQENNQNYVVLAEENTSAAANGISETGYAPYYGYPGGNLYQFFIEMSHNPSLDILEKAKETFLVNRVYFIVSPYLPPFNEAMLEKAKKMLPIYKQFDDKVYIFRYPKLN